MKKKYLKKQVLASVMAATMAVSLLPNTSMVALADLDTVNDVQSTKLSVMSVKGAEESLYATWNTLNGVEAYCVYTKLDTADDSSYVRVDDSLIRCYGSYWRVDVVGLAAGNYTVKVEAVMEDGSTQSETSTTSVSNYDRTGFAWVNGTASGAYNEDGTLKANAVVLYLTEETKDSMQLDVVTSSKGTTTACTGITEILTAYKKGYDNRPLDIRVIGKVTNTGKIKEDKDCKGDIVISGSGDTKRLTCGITVEGIGDDATAYGWGLRIKNASNVEVRNIGFMMCDSDEGDNVGLQQGNDHVWVHNCDMFYGQAGGDSDQAKGDGALDCKLSTYVTFSYNHFWDNGKCNLLGLKEGKTEGYYITYHHNWYDHSDSRHPRCRYYSAHVYNNYYDGNSKYGVGSTLGSSVFVEANYFRNCPYPIMTSMQGSDVFAGGTVKDVANNATFSKENGGTVKAYANIMTGAYTFIPYGSENYILKGEEVAFDLQDTSSVSDFDAVVVNTADETIDTSIVSHEGGNTYNNFDTSSEMYEYQADVASEVPQIVTSKAGRLDGGDFEWIFTEEDDASYSVNADLKAALLGYTSSVVSIGGSLTNKDEEPVTPEESSEETESTEETSTTNEETGSQETETTETESTEETEKTEESVAGATYVQNFTTDGLKSDFFEISGNLSTSKGTVVYNGLTLTQCLKIETATSIRFQTDADSELTLVFNTDFSKSIKIDGTKVSATNGIVTVSLTEGEHAITKGDSTNLYYMSLEVQGNESIEESESTEESAEESTEESKSTDESVEESTEESESAEESTEESESTEETKEPEETTGYKSGKDYVVAGVEAPSAAVAGDIFVRPGAQGSGSSFEDAMDFVMALTKVEAGHTIWMEAGNYAIDQTIVIEESNAGNEAAKKTIKAYGNGEAILDFSNQELDSANRGMVLDGSFWHIYGVTFYGAGDNGMLLSGDNNIIENCRFDSNRDSGLQISRYNTSYADIATWPSNNLIKNSAAYNNCDASGENADGFAAKLTCGEGNVFDGCLSYNNSDDGWDLYAKTATGPIGVITLKNCAAFRNGTLLDGTTQDAGDRNGFKLGGSGVGTPHVVINCIAFENGTCGFTDNNNPTAITLKNCTSINNGRLDSNKANYNLYRENKGINENLISYNASKIGSDNFEGTLTNSVYYNKDKGNYYWISDTTAVSGKAKIGTVVTVKESDFVSLKAPASNEVDFQTYFRYEDGSLNLRGYGEIAEESTFASLATDGKALGARFEQVAEEETKEPEVPETEETEEPEVPETEETEEPEVPETEETKEPEVPETEESQVPETPVTEIVTAAGTWVSGNYQANSKVTVSVNESRIILTEELSEAGAVEAGNSYKVIISDSSFRMYIREVKDGVTSSIYVTNGQDFEVVEGAKYYAGLYSVDSKNKDITFEGYVDLFKNGMNVSFEQMEKAIVPGEITFAGKSAEWVSGNYGMAKAELNKNVGRISLAEKFSVEEDTEFTAVVTDGFRVIVRVTNQDSEKVTKTMYLTNGTTFKASAEEDYYITVYATSSAYKNMDYAQYVDLLANGILVVDLK